MTAGDESRGKAREETALNSIIDAMPVHADVPAQAVLDDLPSQLRRLAAEEPHRPAVADPAGVYTRAELVSRAHQIANRLIAGGLRRGDTVAALAANSRDYVALLAGTLAAGGCLVPLPTSATAQTLALMQKEYFYPAIADRFSPKEWNEKGRPDMLQRAAAEKRRILDSHFPRHVPREVFGDLVRLTLGYNPGAAFGMYLGEHSRWIFLGLALLILVFLGIMYREARPTDRIRALALGLVSGGVIGNVINRIWSAGGVVDFLDLGIGAARWPTFNVADIGVTVGAFLLAWVLWSEQGGASSEASGTNARQAQTNP